MHALKINPFIRRDMQLSFYANETTSPVHGKACRGEEHSIDFYPQCFNNPGTGTSPDESEHDKTKIMTCVHSVLYYQPGDQSSPSVRRKFGSLSTHKAHSEESDQSGRTLRLIVFLSGCTDHLVDSS